MEINFSSKNVGLDYFIFGLPADHQAIIVSVDAHQEVNFAVRFRYRYFSNMSITAQTADPGRQLSDRDAPRTSVTRICPPDTMPTPTTRAGTEAKEEIEIPPDVVERSCRQNRSHVEAREWFVS
jgi:hypothetical protein